MTLPCARALALKARTPIANGKHRLVFEHPHDSALLVKVMRFGSAATGPGFVPREYPWYRRPRRYRQYLSYLREVMEHLALHAELNALPPYVQHLVGFADTDYGLGLVSRKMVDRSGALAPTLSQLIREGRMDAEAGAALERFFAWFLESPLRLGDINTRNLVYAWDAEHGQRFVVIDGLGQKTFVPLQNWSWTRARVKRGQVARMRRKMAKQQAAVAARAGGAPP